jgi:uncharacterized protein (TIGR00730 family)
MKKPEKKRIAVFCGSSNGLDPSYTQSCIAFARIMYDRDIGIVYGGGNVGLMGVLADEMLRLGGEVTGVIPLKLVEIELAHPGCTNLHIVSSMHERKALMAKLSDAFLALPGGIGTLEELFEVFTWLQLGYHNKPVGILNVNGFYDLMLEFLKQLVGQGFILQGQFDRLMVFNKPEDLTRLLDKI